MKFVQFADAHLDSSISGRLCLPADKRDVVREDIRKAVSRAFALAADIKAELLLIPGDLFDYECLRDDTTAFLTELIRRVAPARVFIAPGNHDSVRPGSPYSPASGIEWPENVHIFRSAEFETVEIPELGCAVTGIGHVHRGVSDRLLSGEPRGQSRPQGHLLVFHGSRDGYRPSEKENVIPFSDADLCRQGFTYAAIGHYHSFGAIEDDSGVRGAYSGCIQGRGLDETGEKFVIAGEIEHGQVRIEKIGVAERRVVSVEADVSGVQDGKALEGRVRDALNAAGVRSCDVVNVALVGRVPPGTHLNAFVPETWTEFFHVSVDVGSVEQDYDLDALCADSSAEKLRSAFVREMRRKMDTATDEEERATLRDASYYGLCALDDRKLEPRDAG